MLPKPNRLTKKKDFDTVFKEGTSVKYGFLIVKVIKNQLTENRFGIVVSKKISAKATVRNKVKRRIRNAIFSQLGVMQASFDVVIITLPGIEKKEFLELQQTLREAFKKLKLTR